MKGDPKVIEALNEVLTAELTAINQYFIHAKMCADQGFHRLAKQKRDDSIGEMKDADEIIDRILFLEGIPNMQRYNPVRVGENPVEMHRMDLLVETEAIERLNRLIPICVAAGDNGTRNLFEKILRDEEEHADHLEGELNAIKVVGAAAYLAEQLKE